jgi:hypothetical protein
VSCWVPTFYFIVEYFEESYLTILHIQISNSKKSSVGNQPTTHTLITTTKKKTVRSGILVKNKNVSYKIAKKKKLKKGTK